MTHPNLEVAVGAARAEMEKRINPGTLNLWAEGKREGIQQCLAIFDLHLDAVEKPAAQDDLLAKVRARLVKHAHKDQGHRCEATSANHAAVQMIDAVEKPAAPATSSSRANTLTRADVAENMRRLRAAGNQGASLDDYAAPPSDALMACPEYDALRERVLDGNLLACPFCGGEAGASMGFMNEKPFAYVECCDCGAEARPDEWQARAPCASLAEDAGAVERALLAIERIFCDSNRRTVPETREYVIAALRAAEGRP